MVQAECCLCSSFTDEETEGLEKSNDLQKVAQWWSENSILGHLTQQWALPAILCSESGLYSVCPQKSVTTGAGEAHISVRVDDL